MKYPRDNRRRGPAIPPTGHAAPSPITTRLAGVFLAGVFLASCSTTTPPTASGGVAHPPPNPHWVKVHSNPPTWYPRGIPADCATGFRDGEWIYTEDPQGTRLFIPLKGLAADRRKELLAEALAARAPEKVNRVRVEEANHRAGTRAAAASLAVLPVVTGAWAIGTWWDYWKRRFDRNDQPDPQSIPSPKNPTPWIPRTTN